MPSKKRGLLRGEETVSFTRMKESRTGYSPMEVNRSSPPAVREPQNHRDLEGEEAWKTEFVKKSQSEREEWESDMRRKFEDELREYRETNNTNLTLLKEANKRMETLMKENQRLNGVLESKETTHIERETRIVKDRLADAEMENQSLKERISELQETITILETDREREASSPKTVEVEQVAKEVTVEREGMKARADLLRRVYSGHKHTTAALKNARQASASDLIMKIRNTTREPVPRQLVTQLDSIVEDLNESIGLSTNIIKNYFTTSEKLSQGIPSNWFHPDGGKLRPLEEKVTTTTITTHHRGSPTNSVGEGRSHSPFVVTTTSSSSNGTPNSRRVSPLPPSANPSYINSSLLNQHLQSP